ncbi:MAG: protein phosphatase 2C domain-containing protein [Candidatus Woesearchaeota archaeon]
MNQDRDETRNPQDEAVKIITLDRQIPIAYAVSLLDSKLLQNTGWDVLDDVTLRQIGFVRKPESQGDTTQSLHRFGKDHKSLADMVIGQTHTGELNSGYFGHLVEHKTGFNTWFNECFNQNYHDIFAWLAPGFLQALKATFLCETKDDKITVTSKAIDTSIDALLTRLKSIDDDSLRSDLREIFYPYLIFQQEFMTSIYMMLNQKSRDLMVDIEKESKGRFGEPSFRLSTQEMEAVAFYAYPLRLGEYELRSVFDTYSRALRMHHRVKPLSFGEIEVIKADADTRPLLQLSNEGLRQLGYHDNPLKAKQVLDKRYTIDVLSYLINIVRDDTISYLKEQGVIGESVISPASYHAMAKQNTSLVSDNLRLTAQSAANFAQAVASDEEAAKIRAENLELIRVLSPDFFLSLEERLRELQKQVSDDEPEQKGKWLNGLFSRGKKDNKGKAGAKDCQANPLAAEKEALDRQKAAVELLRKYYDRATPALQRLSDAHGTMMLAPPQSGIPVSEAVLSLGADTATNGADAATNGADAAIGKRAVYSSLRDASETETRTDIPINGIAPPPIPKKARIIKIKAVSEDDLSDPSQSPTLSDYVLNGIPRGYWSPGQIAELRGEYEATQRILADEREARETAEAKVTELEDLVNKLKRSNNSLAEAQQTAVRSLGKEINTRQVALEKLDALRQRASRYETQEPRLKDLAASATEDLRTAEREIEDLHEQLVFKTEDERRKAETAAELEARIKKLSNMIAKAEETITPISLKRMLYGASDEDNIGTICGREEGKIVGYTKHGVFTGISDKGIVRKNNEDAMLILSEEEVFVVADGMGGHSSGEIASRIAVETIDKIIRAGEGIYLGINHAKKIIDADNDPLHNGMGTTINAFRILNGNILQKLHIGDSRTYVYKGGVLEYISKDHSVFQESIDLGYVSPEEEANIRKKNEILGTIMKGKDDAFLFLTYEMIRVSEGQVSNEGRIFSHIKVNYEDRSGVVNTKTDPIHLEAGDLVLQFSDGLNDTVSQTRINELVAAYLNNPAELAEQLTAEAKANGGKDNITIIVYRHGLHPKLAELRSLKNELFEAKLTLEALYRNVPHGRVRAEYRLAAAETAVQSRAEEYLKRAEAANDALASATEGIQNLETTIKHLTDNNQRLTAERDNLIEQRSAMEAGERVLNDDIGIYRAQNQELIMRAKELERSLTEAKNALRPLQSVANDYVSEIEQLRAQLDASQRQYREQKSALHEREALYEARGEQLTDYETQLANQQQQLSEQQQQLTRQVEQLSSKQEEQLAAYEVQVSALNDRLVEAGSELTAKITTLEEAAAERDQITGERDALRSANEELTERINDLGDTVAELQDKFEYASDELKSVRVELDKALAEKDVTRDNIAKEYVLKSEIDNDEHKDYVRRNEVARDYVPKDMYAVAVVAKSTAEEKATTAQRALEEANTGFMQYKIKLNDMLDLIEKALDEGNNND